MSRELSFRLLNITLTVIFSVRDINWDYVGDSVPAFLTLIIIPLTYKYVSLILSIHV